MNWKSPSALVELEFGKVGIADKGPVAGPGRSLGFIKLLVMGSALWGWSAHEAADRGHLGITFLVGDPSFWGTRSHSREMTACHLRGGGTQETGFRGASESGTTPAEAS